jgi:hypothetical protein
MKVESGKYKSILFISDQHFPYNHPDIIAFLSECKSVFKPDRVVNVGDETDGHSISFHTHDPDLLSPSAELKEAIERMRPLYKLFPKMDLMESNHGSLVYRRGKAFGIPQGALKSYRDVLEAPPGWEWHDYLILQPSHGAPIFICHGRTSNGMANGKNVGMNFVQGHHHSKFDIQCWANDFNLYWAMTVGCLIERRSLAFAYGKTMGPKPIIGLGVVIDGWPRLVPMKLDSHGRWIGKL